MWPRSSRFDRAVTQSHDVAVSVALWSPGGQELIAEQVDYEGGSVTASRTATHRASCTVDLIDRDGTLARVLSSTGGQTVLPYELVIRRGIAYPDGTRELLPLGVFVIAGFRTAERVRFQVTAHDRSRRVSRHRWTSPYVIQPGISYVQAAATLVQDRLPFPVDVEITTGNADVILAPIVFVEQDDPWAKAQQLADTAGCDIYFDRLGRLVIRDIPTGLGRAEWLYSHGENSILLPDSEQQVSDEPGYNAVLAIGENSANEGSVPRFLAYDDDPASPTYFHGDYGQVTEIFTDSTVTDPDRAALVARSRLRRWLGRNNTMTLATVPHPAHDPGDIVQVEWFGVSQTMAVDQIQMPLDNATAASLSCRSQLEEAS